MLRIIPARKIYVFCLIIFGVITLGGVIHNHTTRRYTRHDDETLYELFESTKRVQDDYECVMMNYSPSTWICLYSMEEDRIISGVFHNDKVFEKGCVMKVIRWLEEFPFAVLLDLGANIGTYSLPAAASGHNVVAVEPNLDTAERLYKSVKMGGLENRVSIVRNAVSNVRNVTYMMTNPENRGVTVIEQQPHPNSTNSVRTILLTDLIPLIPNNQAVLKIDVEAYEHFVFSTAEEFFDRVDVRRIFMEWGHVKHRGEPEAPVEHRQLFDHMLAVLYQRGFRPNPCIPCSIDRGDELQKQDWSSWPLNICWYRDI